MRKLLYIAIFTAGFSSLCFSSKTKDDEFNDEEAAKRRCDCVWAPPSRCNARANQPSCQAYCARKIRNTTADQSACEEPE